MLNFLKNLGTYLLVLLIVYAVLSFFSWNLNPGEWNGFWRVIFGLSALLSLVIFGD
jgi:hypothetical protein